LQDEPDGVIQIGRIAAARGRHIGDALLPQQAEPLFATALGRPLDRTILRRSIHTTGERAGVPDAHPHRFRYAFAITFLRNGGNVFALQTILGHESLDMVKRYLMIAQTDLQKAHQDASPVMNWLL
jgi:site-specific recombinase XerD